MVKCSNPECENHGKELEANTKICRLCGGETKQFKADSNTNIGVIACIAALLAVPIFWYANMWFGFIVSAAGIVTAFISKSKISIAVSFICSAAVIGLLISLIYF
jgi:uncharacterized protein (DUF983 family)